MKTKLFQQMTPNEQLQWATEFGEFLQNEWPQLQSVAKQNGIQWTINLQHMMYRLLNLLKAWAFAGDFCEAAARYGDYSARVYRMPIYVEKVQELLAAQADESILAVITAASEGSPLPNKRRGRPASPETIARREAEAKAAQQQVPLFTSPSPSPAGSGSVAANPASFSAGSGSVAASPVSPFISPSFREDTDYKLSIPQKRCFLSPELQSRADTIRILRSNHAAACERAKTMSDLKSSPESIAPVAKEAIETHNTLMAIYAAIDEELAVLWYRLQNDSDKWRTAWLQKYGFLKPNATAPSGSAAGVIHPDLLHDLRKHYQKVQSPEFDLRCRTLIEQESPDYIKRKKEEAAKKKEVKDILRYLKRKDKSQKPDTARTKFKRLEQLLGKKAAADYKPLLTKIEDDAASKK